MLSLRLLNRAKPVQHARLISNFPTLKDSNPSVPNAQEPASKNNSSNPCVMGPRFITPRPIDKRILVWMKVYKSVDEIPNQITYEQLNGAQDWFRIRVANWMMVGTIIGAGMAIWYGKRRAERGESIEQMNIDWHKQIKAEYQAAKVAEATAGK